MDINNCLKNDSKGEQVCDLQALIGLQECSAVFRVVRTCLRIGGKKGLSFPE